MATGQGVAAAPSGDLLKGLEKVHHGPLAEDSFRVNPTDILVLSVDMYQSWLKCRYGASGSNGRAKPAICPFFR